MSAFSEAIDLETSSSKCQALPQFPLNKTHAFGVLYQNMPLVCGGYAISLYKAPLNKCYLLKLNAWIPKFSLQVERATAAAAPSPFSNSSILFLVIGGENPLLSSQTFNSAEILTTQGWEMFSPPLPVNISGHCMVTFSSTTMVIGGNQNGTYSKNSFIITDTDKQWKSGPAMINARSYFACSRIPKNGNSNQLSTIAVGAVGSYSTEVLDDDAKSWRLGPRLPMTSYGHSLVQDPSGGVLLLGGMASGFTGLSNKIYRLNDAGPTSNWTLLGQTLGAATNYFAAFSFLDSMINCTIT